MTDWREQEATNQTIFRDMNEWTEEANDAHSQEVGIDQAAQAIDHEDPEIDRVLAGNERSATVEKFYGAGARIARSSDPRRLP